MQTRLIITFIYTVSCVYACSIGAKKNNQGAIDALKNALGIEPFYPDADLNTTGYTDTYIVTATDLDCNFDTTANPQIDAVTPTAQPMSLCQWKNLPATPNVDNEDYYMFTKTGKQTWALLRPARGGTKQTPADGDAFVLAGHQGLPAAEAVLYSSPVKCSQNPLTLSFDYWLYSTAKVRVLVLQQSTFTVLYNTTSDMCSASKPTTGRCIVTVPPQTGPFHLAIQSLNLATSFAIIDNTAVSGDIGAQCVGGAGYDFTKPVAGTPLPSRASAGSIKSASDLNCPGGATCDWSNASPSQPDDIPFESVAAGTGPASNPTLMQTTTGESSVPTGPYLFAQAPPGATGRAKLMSDYIDCQHQDGTLTFQAWLANGTMLNVCTVDATTLATKSCTPVTPPMQNGQYSVPIYGPLMNARIMFVASNWNSGKGGYVALDNIQYTAVLCSQETTTPAATVQPVDTDLAACTQLNIHFGTDYATAQSKWSNLVLPSPGSTQVVQYQIATTFALAQSTAVKCPDGGKCAGCVLDASLNQISGMQSQTITPPLARPHYLQLNVHRGTFGTGVFVCTNTPPTPAQNSDISVAANPQCAEVSGPALTYTEWTSGLVVGAVLPAGTSQVYIIFTNPVGSGSDVAGFLIDRITMLRDSQSSGGPMC